MKVLDRRKPTTLLRAVGASGGFLLRNLLAQVLIVIGLALVVAIPLTVAAVRGASSAEFSATVEPSVVATTSIVLIVLGVLWKTWVLTPPQARARKPARSTWTDRVGLALAVSWPLQCGFLLVVLDSKMLPPMQ